MNTVKTLGATAGSSGGALTIGAAWITFADHGWSASVAAWRSVEMNNRRSRRSRGGANAGHDNDDHVRPLARTSSTTHVRANASHDRDDDRHHVRQNCDDGCAQDHKGAPSANAGYAPYRIAVTLCSECKRGWQHGGGAVEEMSPPAVEAALCDAQWIGDLSSGLVERARQEIPPATRRKVLHRDQERCRVPGCRASNNLDIHHILRREDGGTNDISGLITLCEAHHLAHHAGTLVVERVGEEVTFRREGRNRFTRATREVETKEALRARGFARDQVKEVMTRTAKHVGANDISAEQWLTIAMRYAADLPRQ